MPDKTAIIFCAFTVLLWGFWGFFGKLALDRGMLPLPVLGIESVTSVICVIAVLAVARGGVLGGGLGSVSYAHFNIFGVLSGVSLAIGLLFYYFALDRGSTSMTVGLTSTYPIVATMLSVVFLKERLAAAQWVGLVLIIAGIFLLVGRAKVTGHE